MRVSLGLVMVLSLASTLAAADSRAPARSGSKDSLAAPQLLHVGGKAIDVAGFAAPFFADFDNDGRRDLMVGQLEHGRLRIYTNVGSNNEPKFDRFEWFQAGGRIAGIPSGCRVGFTPQLVDYNDDGLSDIVTGSFHGALLYVFLRQHDGAFSEAQVLENRSGQTQFLDLKYNSTLFVHDWDADGAKDLIVGRRAAWVRNEGTTARPLYSQSVPLLPELSRGPYGAPTVADWDGDGLHDLLIAGQDVVWYRNTGTKNHPELDSPRVLISNRGASYLYSAAEEVNRDRPAMIYSICVTDFDNDGYNDILLGDWYTTENVITEEQAEANKQNRKRRSEFARSYYRSIKDAPKAAIRSDRIASFRTALKTWDDLGSKPFDGPQAAHHRLKRHGGVWLYRRLHQTDR